MDIVGRLIYFRDFTGLSSSQFADKAAIPRPTLSQFLSGRNKRLSDDLANKIHIAFPELNMMWLLFGEGEMVLTSNIQFSEAKNDLFGADSHAHLSEIQPNQSGAPLFPDGDILDENRNLDSKSHENLSRAPEDGQSIEEASASISPAALAACGSGKRIQSIMVFYTDNSFEIFTPGGKQADSL